MCRAHPSVIYASVTMLCPLYSTSYATARMVLGLRSPHQQNAHTDLAGILYSAAERGNLQQPTCSYYLVGILYLSHHIFSKYAHKLRRWHITITINSTLPHKLPLSVHTKSVVTRDETGFFILSLCGVFSLLCVLDSTRI